MNKENIIKIKEGRFCPPPLVIPAIAIMVGMLYIIFSPTIELTTFGIVISPLLLIGSGLVATTTTGIQINTKENIYRKYYSIFFFFYLGKWKPNVYKQIAIRSHKVSKAVAGSTVNRVTSNQLVHDIVLINNKKKIMIKRFHDLNKASKEIESLSVLLNAEIIKLVKKKPVYLKR